jgi:radical SAM superfamily enzyme YgiQ (UPF0313 family)
MKVLLIYKGRYHVRDAVTFEYISALAKLNGHETALVYDQDIFGITDNVMAIPFLNRLFSNVRKIIKKGTRQNPQVAVFLDGFNRSRWNKEVAQELKRADNSVITVSCSRWHPSSCEPYDYVLVGEPEAAMEKFFADEIFNREKGVYEYKELSDLNMLPLPDKTLFAPYVNFKDSYMLYTSKGCIYDCAYCEETIDKQALGDNYFRRRNPENVIWELKTAKEKFAVQEVIYKDSVFALDKAWLKAYLELYKKEINLPYKCFGKAEVFDEEIALMLKESGCYCVEFGAQTFNEHLKRNILKRNEKTSVLLNAFSLCEKYGLRYDIDHMFGIPGERTSDHLHAAKIYLELGGLNRIKCHNLVYYPQAKICAYAPQSVKENKDYQADFFSTVSGEKDMLKINKIFTKYFKVLPLFARRLNLFILENNHWKAFAYIPNILILILMMILAIKKRDRRFAIYGKLYFRKVTMVLRQA